MFMAATAMRAACRTSTSGQTISGFLPPSSRVTWLMFCAALRRIARPVGTEPVNATRGTPGCETSASPSSAPVPVTTLSTPGGSTCAAISARAIADSEVCSPGLTMTALPAASGAADLLQANLNGWLNGTIRSTTP